MLFIAEQRVEHIHAFEVEADIVLVGDADAAMQLNALRGDELAAVRQPHLGDRDRALALVRGRFGFERSQQHRRLAQLQLDEHVDRPVL